MNILLRPDLQPAKRLYSTACRRSRRWNSYVTYNVKRYGDVRGSHTSGCFNPDWPERVKERLRRISYGVTEATNAAHAMRPRFVRTATMRALAQAVASSEGGGYYGPRA